MKFELSNNFKERLKVEIENQNVKFIKSAFHEVSHVDVAELLYEFNSFESKYVLDNIGLETSSKIISELDDDTRENFLKIYSSNEIADVLKIIDSDDGADILLDLSSEVREEVLINIDDKIKSKNLRDLIKYDDEVAGGLMAKELVKCNIDWKIKQCIDLIRKQAKNVSQIYSVYVTDSKGTLMGKVSLKDIIISKDNSKVKDIYDDFVVSVDANMNQEEVAQIMQKYDLTVLPVVIPDIICLSSSADSVITSTTSSIVILPINFFLLFTTDVEEDDSIWKLSNARLPWLVIGILGGLFGAFFLGSFESNYFEENEVFISLSFFIPLIMATAGNVGIQSSSIVIQTLSTPSPFEISVAERLTKVILVSILNGIVLSILVYSGLMLFDYLNFLDFEIFSKTAKIVSVSLFSIVLVSSLLGTLTPIVLNKLKFNPALASGPFITTTNDLMALAIYFIVAIAMGGI